MNFLDLPLKLRAHYKHWKDNTEIIVIKLNEIMAWQLSWNETRTETSTCCSSCGGGGWRGGGGSAPTEVMVGGGWQLNRDAQLSLSLSSFPCSGVSGFRKAQEENPCDQFRLEVTGSWFFYKKTVKLEFSASLRGLWKVIPIIFPSAFLVWVF